MHRRPGPVSRGDRQAVPLGLLALSALALASAACAFGNNVTPTASLTLYGRNAAGDIAWFLVRPVSTPIQAVGFGTDGVACLRATLGSDIVMTDRSPGQDGSAIRVVQVIAPIDDQDETLWVDVAADRSVAHGNGVPGWWAGDPEAC